MLVEVKVPALSESVSEATLLTWHRQVGERVERDENLIDVETDKVVMELPAPVAGVLVEVIKANGGMVVSDEVIARIDTEAVATRGAAAMSSEAPAGGKAPPASTPAAQPTGSTPSATPAASSRSTPPATPFPSGAVAPASANSSAGQGSGAVPAAGRLKSAVLPSPPPVVR
jgi:2-oxoglutarate dehydrogenase E2 component (dihydrolipoamide succinyltransferase)